MLQAEQLQELKRKYEAHVRKLKNEESQMEKLAPSKRLVLDLSAAQQWSSAFEQNSSLIHVDFSHNGFDARELRIMGSGLKHNHSILGLHLSGNEGKVDGLGFIKEYEKSGLGEIDDLAKHLVYTRIPPTLEMGRRSKQS